MSSIDERIVEMKFNNGQFENGIKTTMGSLESLKKGLNLDGAKKSLDGLNESGKNFSLAGMTAGIEQVSGKFLALATIGITALANITNKAIDAGIQIAKSLTIDPVKAGFAEYELKMGAIQTIMAGSGESLDTVNTKLQELNAYSDKTIYSFADMTSNIGKFTNAGLSLDTSVASIQGVANVAALSGANAGEASRAMYNFAQALSSGSVKLMDWKSIELANMATAEFKTELLDSAVASGTLTKGVDGMYTTLKGTPVSATKGFNESLEEQWLTTEALTSTLGRYADANTEIGARATAAAQDVKTFSQMMDTMKESAGSGWATSSELIFGNFEEAKALWTGVNNVLGGMISASADARNKVLSDWKEGGGRALAIEAISNAFNALMDVVGVVKSAFREIFPATTGAQLVTITQAIRDFTEKLKMGGTTSENLKRTFAGVFAVFDIGWMVIKQIAGVFATLFGEIAGGTGSVLNFTAGIGDFLVSVRDAIKNGEGLTNFFDGIKTAISKVAEYIEIAAYWIGRFFSSLSDMSGTGADGAIDKISARLGPLGRLGEIVSTVWGNLVGILKKVVEFAKPFASAIGDLLGGLGEKVADAMSNVDYSSVLDTINTGLLAGIVMLFKKFVDNGLKVDFGGGMLDSIKEAFGGVTGVLTQMQTNLKADTLIKIAGALALLTISVVALSLIDSAGLTRALTAMTVMFTQLYGSMAIFEKISSSKGFVKMPIIAGAMILLSIAILILTAAVKNLSDLSWEELLKGLVGVGVLMGMISGLANTMPSNTGKMISTGIGIMAIAIAVKILASAVKDFSELSWAEMAQGLAGVGAVLTSLAIFTRIADANKMGLSNGAGLILLAIALKVIASAVEDFAGMAWDELGRGLAGMAAALIIVGVSMRLMPTNMIITAGALVVVAGALLILSEVLKSFAGMTWEEMARGLATLAGSLLIIAGAMALMTTAIFGAAALLVVTASLAMLAPVLLLFAAMSWDEIIRGLTMLAGVFAVLGIAGLVLTPVIPMLLVLGIAVGLLGAGMLMAGAGLLAFSMGLTALSIAGAAGVTALVAIVSGLIALIPMAFEAVATGIIAFAAVIASGGPAFVAAITTVLLSLITAINVLAPQIIATLVNLVMMLVATLVNNVPKLVQAGMQLLIGILSGIANNIGRVVTEAVRIITEFLNGISRNLPKIVQAGINLIITFVESLAAGIRNNTDRMNTAGQNLASAIVQGMIKGITAGVSSIVTAARNMASKALEAAKNFLGINSPSKEFEKVGLGTGEGFVKGVDGYTGKVEKSTETMGQAALNSVKKSLGDISKLSLSGDMTPVIRPVLDLSGVKKDGRLIPGLLDKPLIKTEFGYSRAADIAETNRRIQSVQTEAGTTAAVAPVVANSFTQNNYSPKALSPAEIYRQTRNQLSVVKGGLPK